MVLDDHDVAAVEAGVDATGGVRHDQRRYAHRLHHTHWHGNLIEQLGYKYPQISGLRIDGCGILR